MDASAERFERAKSILQHMATAIVGEVVEVQEVKDGDEVQLHLIVPPECVGSVIGKKGGIVKSMQTVLAATLRDRAPWIKVKPANGAEEAAEAAEAEDVEASSESGGNGAGAPVATEDASDEDGDQEETDATAN